MQVTVTIDGNEETVDVSLDALTLQESCDLEDVLGFEAFARYQDTARPTPKVIRAILWAKLRRQFPNIDVDDFDLDFAAAGEALVEDDPGPFDDKS